MDVSSQMDFSLRLQLEAKKDKIKMIVGAGVMVFALLAVMIFVYVAVQNRMLALIITGVFVVAMFAGAIFLVMRMLIKMEHDSFGQGAHLVMESLSVNSVMLTKDLKIEYCNAAAPELYGFKSRREYRDGFFSIIPEFQPDGSRSLDEIAKFIQTAMSDGKVTFEWWNKMPTTGELIPLEITLVKTVFEGEAHFLEFATDMRAILNAKKNEEAFKKRQQAILDAAPMLCSVCDEQGNIVDVNKEAEKMFGISDKQEFVKRYYDFIPSRQPDGSDSRQRNAETIIQTIRDGDMRFEWMYQTADGHPVPVEEVTHRIDIDGKPFVLTYARDLRGYYKEREKERHIQERIQTMMDQLNTHVTDQSSAITESSASIEEMIANINSVTNIVSRNSENVNGLEEASQVGHAGLNGVVADIREISQESESLLEINSVMQSIASQTNLLSMNAAIEAAHAGESGRGFAVVADEIRKLAENSSKQSKTIGSVLKKIKGSIDKITKSMDNVLGKFDAIEDGVKVVSKQEEVILDAMREQGQGSEQIMIAIGQVNEVTHRVKADAQRMAESNKEAMQKTSMESKDQVDMDMLTGVRNRNYFTQTGERELRICADGGRDFTIVLFGIDHFKHINETYGSTVGDDVLKTLVARTRHNLKVGTFVARYDGDEFAVMLPNVNLRTAVKMATQLHERIGDNPFMINGQVIKVTVSMGVVTNSDNSDRFSELMRKAEESLAKAKETGRNRVVS